MKIALYAISAACWWLAYALMSQGLLLVNACIWTAALALAVYLELDS